MLIKEMRIVDGGNACGWIRWVWIEKMSVNMK